MGSIASSRKLENIVTQLNHPLPAIRYNAARALGELRDVNAVDYLVDTLTSDESESVRRAAADALVLLGVEYSQPEMAHLRAN